LGDWGDLNRQFALAVVALALIGFMSVELSFAQSNQNTVTAIDDTHVDSSRPDSVLGAEKYLDVESYGDSSTSTHQIVWLKFSLSGIPTGAVFSSATLEVYAWFVGGTFNVSAYYCSDNSWTESTLTYVNMPQYGTTPVATVTVASSLYEKWYSWNVVGAVQQALDNNLENVTIVLNEPYVSSQNSVFFYSKETPTVAVEVPAPKLTLSWSSNPSHTQVPTSEPSSTANKTPTPMSSSMAPTISPSSTLATTEQTNWSSWGVPLIVVVVIVVAVVGVILMKRKRTKFAAPEFPPPPPP
jgi:hypothetical protein